MSIAFGNHNYVFQASTADIIIPAPTGIVDDDILVAVMGNSSSAAGSYTPPDVSWTNLSTTSGGYDGSYRYASIFWKRASSESGDYTFTTSSQMDWGIIQIVKGCISTGSPIDVYTNTLYNTLDTIIRAVGITPTTTAGLLWVGMSWDRAITKPSEFTQLDYQSGNYNYVNWAYKLNQSPVATGNVDGSLSTESVSKHAMMLALKPAGPPVLSAAQVGSDIVVSWT